MVDSPLVLVNGQAAAKVPVDDRGLAYGDGLFETIAVSNGQLCLWERHCRRLLAGCRVLQISFNDCALLKKEAEQLLEQKRGDAVVKIILTRGSQAPGYRPSPSAQTLRIVQLQQRQTVKAFYNQGITACFCKQPLATNPRLAGLKHLCRLEQVLARMEWQDEYQEGVMFDDQSNAVEGTMSNLFIICGTHLKTPLIDRCGVRGVMREWIIERCRMLGIEVVETRLSKHELLEADGIFFCNAVIRAWPVRRLATRNYDLTVVHSVLQSLDTDSASP